MTAPQKILILGTNRGAETVADLIGDCREFELTGFVENWDRSRCGKPMLGHPVSWIDDIGELAKTHWAVCSIASNQRWQFVEPVEKMGFRFARLRHPTAQVFSATTLGEGTIVSFLSTVGPRASLGRHVHINRSTTVGHHTEIGDYVTFGAGVNVGGGVTIGDGAWIGLGATILPDLTIGRGAVVGAGSVVTKNVSDHVQVFGVPARVTKTGVDGL